MSLEPSLNGLRRTPELPGDFGDGTAMRDNLFDCTTLNGNIVTRGLLFRHERLRRVKGFLTGKFDKIPIGQFDGEIKTHLLEVLLLSDNSTGR